MSTKPILLVVALGLGACATGLVDDVPSTATRPDAAAAIVDAARAETSEDASAGGDAGTDAAVEADAVAVPVVAPVVDGNVQVGEYGVHSDGQNQQRSNPTDPASTTWYVTWTETHLYVGIAAANSTEGVVIYVDHAPLTPSNSGTGSDGSLAGVLYDGAKVGTLPFRADFAVYAKAGYNEYRIADGANGWSTPTVGAINFQASGATRELAIPWSSVRPGGRPVSFAWLGYATSAAGYVYGAMPSDNAAGVIGQNASYGFFYKVTDATPGTGTKPFALKTTP